jgi:nucleoside permease NupC
MIRRNFIFLFFVLAYCVFSCALQEKLNNADITIEVIQNIGSTLELYNEVKKFYIEIAGYGGDLNADDTVIIARKNADLVGSCRVSTEENVKILRRLFIVPL